MYLFITCTYSVRVLWNTTVISITAPFNNIRNLKFKSPTTVAFFAAVNHNLNICTLAINGPWKTETYKNNKMDRNPPQQRTWPFDPMSTDCEKQKPSEWIEIHQSQERTWPSTMLIDSSENATVGGDLNFRFLMLLKGVVTLSFLWACLC